MRTDRRNDASADFRRTIRTDPNTPRTAVQAAFGNAAPDPLLWADWTGAAYRHAGANDPAIRMAELDLPDVVGAKYRVGGGRGVATGLQTLDGAVGLLLDRRDYDESIVADGSGRPLLTWNTRSRTKRIVIHYVGASAKEAEFLAQKIREEGMTSGAEPVILRVRMRRSTLDRLTRCAEFDRVACGDNDTTAGRNLSAYALNVLLKAVEADEAKMERLRAAGVNV
jgi:hypothetical protein